MFAQFFQQQLDYIFFFYGLAFILLASICFGLPQVNQHRLPFALLGMFGLIHGISEWLDMIAMSQGENTVFSIIRLGMMALSFVFLFEFSRVSWQRLMGKGPGKWIYLPLSIIAISGLLAGLSGLNVTIRYTFGLVGGFWAALVLLRTSKSEKYSHQYFVYAAVFMVLYAVATGSIGPAASFFPASVINQTAFLSAVGVPIQLIRGILALFITGALWQSVQKNGQSVSLRFDSDNRTFFGLQFTLAMAIIVLAGLFVVNNFGNKASQESRNDFINQTGVAAASLNPDSVNHLISGSTAIASLDYQVIREQLINIDRSNDQINSLYLMLIQNGKVQYAADSKEDVVFGHIQPGTIYINPPKELLHVFVTGQPVIIGPYSNNGNTLITVFKAIKNPLTQEIYGVLGVDFDASDWQTSVFLSRLPYIGITLLFCLLLTAFFLIRQNMWETSRQIGISENQLTEAQKVAQIGSWTHDIITSQATWSKEMFQIYGRDPEAGVPNYLEFQKFVQPADLPEVDQAFQNAIQKGTGYELESRILIPDGSIKYIFTKAEVKRSLNGENALIIGTSQDITESKRAERLTEALYEMSKATYSTGNMNELFQSIHRVLLSIIPGNKFFIALLTNNKDTLCFPYCVDENGPANWPNLDMNTPKSLTIEALKSKRPLLLNEAQLQAHNAAVSKKVWGTEPKCWLGVPLMLGDSAIGVMVIQDYHNINAYSEKDVALLELAANQIAIAIERKRSEDSVRESEVRFRSLFDDSPISLWEEDYSGVKQRLENLKADGVKDFNAFLAQHPEVVAECTELVKVLDVNKATLDLYGAVSKEEMIKNLPSFFPQKGYKYFRNELVKIASGATRFEMETINQTLDGRLKTVHLNWAVMPGYESDLSKTIVSILDITERKLTEESLQNERLLLRTLIDNIPDSIYMMDLEGRKTLVNSAELRFSGAKSEAEVLGKNDFDLYPKELAEKFFSDNLAVMQTGNPLINREEYLFDEKGQKRWLLTSKYPMRDRNSQLIGLVGIGRDITVRKLAEENLRKSEREFRSLFEQAAVGVALTDVGTGEFTKVNQRFCEILGYSVEELKGMTYQKITFPEDLQISSEKMKLLLAGTIRKFSMEKRYIRKDENVIWVNISVSSLWELGENPTSFVAVVEDINEQKLAEKELLEVNRQLQESNIRANELAVQAEMANVAKSEFLANMSHEIRTPLNAIIGMTGLLLDTDLKPHQQDFAETVRSSGEVLLSLINDILDFSKIEAQKMELENQSFYLGHCIEEALDLVSPRASEKKLELAYII